MQTINGLPIKLTVPSKRYMDQFVDLKCAVDMLKMKLFPNSKEITESFAVYNAVRKHFRGMYSLQDENVTVISVGDGSTPRTAATFAYRSNWKCISVDPVLRLENRYDEIERLNIYRCKIEELNLEIDGPVIILHVHSHATIETSLKHIKSSTNERHMISMPCCVPQVHDRKPDNEYNDWGCWSPKNKIKIWRNV